MSKNSVVYKVNRTKQARLLAQIPTQKELARITGIAPCIISDLETGRRSMTPAWAMRIAEAVGTNWTELLDDEIGN